MKLNLFKYKLFFGTLHKKKNALIVLFCHYMSRKALHIYLQSSVFLALSVCQFLGFINSLCLGNPHHWLKLLDSGELGRLTKRGWINGRKLSVWTLHYYITVNSMPCFTQHDQSEEHDTISLHCFSAECLQKKRGVEKE